MKGHTDAVYSVAYNPDGTNIASASYDKTVRVWNVKQQQEIAQFKGHTDAVMSVAYSPDGTQIASAARDRTVRVWDVKQQQEIAQLKGHTDAVYSVAYSPDGTQIASASRDGTVRAWDLKARSEIAQLKGHSDAVNSVTYSPDGTQIASASGNLFSSEDNTVRVWDLSGRELAKLSGHQVSVISVAYSPDGTQIASASWDKTVTVWDVKQQKQIGQFKGHQGRVWSVAYSPDGSQIASAGNDGTVIVWDVKQQKQIAPLLGDTSFVISVAYSPDGSQIASAGNDGTVTVWENNWDNLFTLVCNRLKYHPILLDIKVEDFKAAGNGCLKYSSWDNTEKAVFQRNRALNIAKDGDYKLASKELKQALKRDQTIDLNPSTPKQDRQAETVAKKLAAPFIVKEAIAKAKNNDIDEAISKRSATRCALLKQAEKFSPGIDLNPDTKELDKEPKITIAPFIVQNAIPLAQNKQIQDAISKRSATRCVLFKKAQTLNPDVDLNPRTKRLDKNPEAIAKELAALSIVTDAIAKAQINDIKVAISKRSATRCALFKKAQRLNPNVDLNPRTKRLDKNPEAIAKQVAALSIVTDAIRTADLARGERAKAQINDIKGAISKRSATRCAAQYRFKQLSFWLEEFGEVLALENKLSDDAS